MSKFEEEMNHLEEELIDEYRATKDKKQALEKLESRFIELIKKEKMKLPDWAMKFILKTWEFDFRFKLLSAYKHKKTVSANKQVTSFGKYLIPFSLVAVLTGLWATETNTFWLILSSFIFLVYFYTVHSYFMQSKSQSKFMYLFISIIAPLFLVYKLAPKFPGEMSGTAFIIAFGGMLYVYYYGRRANIKTETEAGFMNKYYEFLFIFLPMLFLVAGIQIIIQTIIQLLGNPSELDSILASTSFYAPFCYFFILSYISILIVEKIWNAVKKKIIKI